ncbi:molybdopterin-containing oxidoreductase family protein [Adlercreutzia caecimuris]|uniref:DMSO reductase n=1 Tax=Adlercreutzia caecimuris TaxID=671266 RepID=A0A4V3WUZ1_9ACTN|nr:molybdopterin-dependent oxidoreductase [Adlercreutzia caecimuris]THG37697.1 DMSO reductase [Adlercreutzia caecimuris]
MTKNVECARDPKISRRAFVGAAAATAAVAGLAGCAPTAEPKDEASGGEVLSFTGEDEFADCELVYGCCSPECQHHLLKGYVRDGKLVKVESGEVNESPACARGFARVEMCNSEKRLTKPLKLVGEKGSGNFEEISWDEAYDLIEEKLRYALDNGGSQSIIVQGGSGNFSSLTSAMGTLGSWLGGTTAISGNFCCAGIDSGLGTVLGSRTTPLRNELEKADYIIAWGNNPVVTMTGYFGRFQKMMDNGGTLCTIDPFLSETADKSQEWIQPWPGTDSAVALAMLKVVIDEGLTDDEYLIAHTTAPCLIDKKTNAPAFTDPADDTTYQVYDPASKKLVAHDAAGVTPPLSVEGTDIAKDYVTIYDLVKAEADKWGKEAVEAETGCSYDDIARIARDYANAEKAIIIQNMGGYQRTENGAYATATQVYLALFCGHIGHEGDGMYDAGGSAALVPSGQAFESNPDAGQYEPIPFPHFGEMVLEDKPTKINFMWVDCGNPVAQMPNTNMWKKALEHIPFVVKVDQFMNSTCLWSDLVLPNTALFETPNITHSARSAVIQISEAGVTPPGEAKTDLEITAEVAKRFGFEQYFNEDPSVYISRVLEGSGVTYDELVEKKGVNAWDLVPGWIAYKDGNFDTSTGKAHLWVQAWVDEGFPAIACHQRPAEHPLNADSDLAKKYPLAAVQRKTRHQVHTIFNNLETMLSMDGHKPLIVIHPDDAAARSVAMGDEVTVFNDRGEHSGLALVSENVKPGVVVLQNGWDDTTASPTSNVTNNAWPTLGTIHCCNSTLVEVKKGA